VSSYDALVIGAGPAGSTAALLLARRGMKVVVVEKASFPRRKVCGEFISATTWPLLRELGVADVLADDCGPPVDRVGLFAGADVIASPMPAPPEADAWGRSISREILDTALLERASMSGAAVIQPASVIGVEREARRFRATMQGASGRAGGALLADIVVAAHGSWERGALPSQAARAAWRPADLLGFKATYSNASLAPGLMPLVLFPGGYGGMVHGAGGRVGFSCCIRRDALAACRARHHGLSAGEAVMAHVMASCRGVREALDGARLEGPWLSAGPIQPGARALQSAGYYGVGNAAGEAHPLIAEGISMAIQSAWLLDQRLARGGYERMWKSNFSARVRASSIFAALTMSPLTDGASVALLRRVPAILTWGARWSGKAQPPQAAR
jgi:flavin-dependent dehydrogenase